MTYRSTILALAAATLAAALLGVTASKAEARSYGVCSQDTLFDVQVGHLPAQIGSFRNELVGQSWRFYADQAREAALPTIHTPVPCNPSLAPLAANYAKAAAHTAKFVAVLSTLPGRHSAAKPTTAQWRMVLSEAAQADVYGAAVLKALGGENLAATNWVQRVETDRAWIIATAKAIR